MRDGCRRHEQRTADHRSGSRQAELLQSGRRGAVVARGSTERGQLDGEHSHVARSGGEYVAELAETDKRDEDRGHGQSHAPGEKHAHLRRPPERDSDDSNQQHLFRDERPRDSQLDPGHPPFIGRRAANSSGREEQRRINPRPRDCRTGHES